MSVNLIRSKILTKLNEMGSLKVAFDYETSNPDGKYPFASLTLRQGRSEFRSTQHNQRNRFFNVRIFQERTAAGQGPNNAEDIATQVIDEMETAFDMDTTLSGTCKYVQPIEWNAGYIDRETDTRILEVVLQAIEIVQSS
jgi:hypothetical protein